MCFVNFKLIILSFLLLTCFKHLKAADDDFEEAKSQQLNGYHESDNDSTSITSSARRRTIKPFKTYQTDCCTIFNSYCSNKVLCGEEETKNELTCLMNEVFTIYGSAKLELLLNDVVSHHIEDQASVEIFEQWFEEHKAELLSKK